MVNLLLFRLLFLRDADRVYSILGGINELGRVLLPITAGLCSSNNEHYSMLSQMISITMSQYGRNTNTVLRFVNF